MLLTILRVYLQPQLISTGSLALGSMYKAVYPRYKRRIPRRSAPQTHRAASGTLVAVQHTGDSSGCLALV